MTALINQKTINGLTTTFLNYVNPLVKYETNGYASITTFLTTHWGNDATKWAIAANGIAWGLRFPTAWETKTGSISSVSSSTSNSDIGASGARCVFASMTSGNTSKLATASTNTTIGVNVNATYTNSLTDNQKIIAVINDYALAVSALDNTGQYYYFCYLGWAKDPQFKDSNYPRNLVGFGGWAGASNGGNFEQVRVTQENLSNSKTNLYTTLPAISCSISTPAANAGDLLFRDGNSPFNYIGKAWHYIRMPSSAVVGNIYKNTGVDPDTGSVETDQKAFWLCVGSWGSDKIGMRVWTEGMV